MANQPNIVDWLTFIVLALTLFGLLLYTFYTSRLAKSAVASEKRTQEELSLRKRPVVSITCGPRPADAIPFHPTSWYDMYPLVITNLSSVHAKLKIRTAVRLKGMWFDIPSTSYYGGQIWNLQAGTQFPGNLNWPEDLDFGEEFTMESAKELMPGAVIRMRSWSRNYFELASESVEVVQNENPTLYWSWNGKRWLAQPAEDFKSFDAQI